MNYFVITQVYLNTLQLKYSPGSNLLEQFQENHFIFVKRMVIKDKLQQLVINILQYFQDHLGSLPVLQLTSARTIMWNYNVTNILRECKHFYKYVRVIFIVFE